MLSNGYLEELSQMGSGGRSGCFDRFLVENKLFLFFFILIADRINGLAQIIAKFDEQID
jgi:hypothetical protein